MAFGNVSARLQQIFTPARGEPAQTEAVAGRHQAAAPGGPRNPLRMVADAVRGLVGRSAGGEAAAPRAASEARALNAAASLGATVGRLVRGQGDGGELALTAAALAGVGGDEGAPRLGQFVDRALAGRSPAELANLVRTTTALQITHAPTRNLADTLVNAATERLMETSAAQRDQSMAEALGRLRAAVAEDGGQARIAGLLQRLWQPTVSHHYNLNQVGLAPSGTHADGVSVEQRSAALAVHAALNTLSADERAAVFAQASPYDLGRLLHDAGPEAPLRAEIEQVAGERFSAAAAAFRDDVARLRAGTEAEVPQSLADPRAFAADVCALAERWGALNSFAADVGLELDGASRGAHRELVDALGTSIGEERLLAGELNNAQLGRLAAALRAVVPRAERAAILAAFDQQFAAESERRLAEPQAALRDAYTGLIASTVDTPEVRLRVVLDAVRAEATLTRAAAELMQRNGGDEVTQLTQTAFEQACAVLDTEDFAAVAAHFSGAEWQALGELFESLGAEPGLAARLGVDESVLSRAAVRVFTLPQAMDIAAAERAAIEPGFVPPAPVGGAHATEVARAGAALAAALETELGVVGDAGARTTVRGFMAGEAREVLRARLETPLSDGERNRTVTTRGGFEISEQLFKDLNRAGAQIRIDGEEVFDFSAWDGLGAAARETRIDEGLARLRESSGGADNLLQLSRFLHQGVAAAVEQAFAMAPDAPLRTGDGEAVRMTLGQARERWVFDVRGIDGDGVDVDFALEREGVTTWAGDDGRQRYGDPDHPNVLRAGFAFHLDFAADHLELTNVPRFDASLRALPFACSYPPPGADALRRADPVRDAEMLGELAAFAARSGRTGLFAGQQLIARQERQPGLEGLRYVRESLLDPAAHQAITGDHLLGAEVVEVFAQMESQVIAQLNGLLVPGNALGNASLWPGGRAPANYQALLASGDEAALRVFREHAGSPRGAPENLAFLDALAALRAQPSAARARELLANFLPSSAADLPEGSYSLNIADSIHADAEARLGALVDARQAVLDGIAGRIDGLRREVVDLFAPIEAQVIAQLDGLLVPGNALGDASLWPGGRAPANYQALLASGDEAALRVFREHAGSPRGAPENLAFLDALAQLRSNPDDGLAREMLATFLPSVEQELPPGIHSLNIPTELHSAAVDRFNALLVEQGNVRQALDAALAAPVDALRREFIADISAQSQNPR